MVVNPPRIGRHLVAAVVLAATACRGHSLPHCQWDGSYSELLRSMDERSTTQEQSIDGPIAESVKKLITNPDAKALRGIIATSGDTDWVLLEIENWTTYEYFWIAEQSDRGALVRGLLHGQRGTAVLSPIAWATVRMSMREAASQSLGSHFDLRVHDGTTWFVSACIGGHPIQFAVHGVPFSAQAIAARPEYSQMVSKQRELIKVIRNAASASN